MSDTVTKPAEDITVGIPEYIDMAERGHGSYRDATLVSRWSHIDFDHPVPLISRTDLHPGDLVQSSFGYRLYITSVRFPMVSRATTTIRGRVHSADNDHEQMEAFDGSIPLLARGGFEWNVPGEPAVVPLTADEAGRHFITSDGRIVIRRIA